jgi:2-desacetyl-2-hydroxyethyl bacteriochlorophyllide A dehydrogenase
MRAISIVTPGNIEEIEVPDPSPDIDEVVVEVAAVGICGTDLHIYEGEFAPHFPITPGHEIAGTVVEVGKDVSDVKIGDQVAVDPSMFCSECFYCKRGRGNLCEKWNALGVSMPGGAAQFLLAPKKNIYKVSDEIDLKTAILIEPLSCAVRGFDQLPRVPGSTYLIYGAGTMGLMMAELARINGAASVSIVDTNPEKLSTAKLLSFSSTAQSADEFDQGRGFEIVIDCSGVVAAIKDGLSRVMPGGTFLQFGVAKNQAKIEIEPYWIYNKEITIIGSMAILHSFERAVKLFGNGVLNSDVMISHSYPLSKYAQALHLFKSGKGRKTIVLPKE